MTKVEFTRLLSKRLYRNGNKCKACQENMSAIARHLNSGKQEFTVTFTPMLNCCGINESWHIAITDKK